MSAHARAIAGATAKRSALAGAVGFACQHLWVTPEEHGEHQPLVGALGRPARVMRRPHRQSRRAHRCAAARARPTSAMRAWCSPPTKRGAMDSPSDSTAISPLAIFDPREQRLLLARDAHRRPAALLLSRPAPVRVRLGDQGAARTSRHRRTARRRRRRRLHADRRRVRSTIRTSPAFDGICSVVPAHIVVVVTPAGLTRRRYWDFDTTQRDCAFDRSASTWRRFGSGSPKPSSAARDRRIRSRSR